MKKLFTILLFLLSFVGFSQSGDGYVNYTSYRTQCNTGCLFTRVIDGTTVWVNGHMNNIGEFDAAMMVDSDTAVSVLNSGETLAFSKGGFGTAINSYDGGRPIGPGNTQGEYYIVDYTGWFYASSTGNYKFSTTADDSHEFYLDLDGDKELESNEIITKKYGGSGTNQSSNIALTSGTWYKLRVRFHEYTGGDWMRIQYQDPTNNGSSNAWRILGDTGWGDKVSNSAPAPDFTNNASDGKNAVYYKVFSINGGDGTVGSHHPDNASQFTTLFSTSTAGTTWTHQGRDTATKALTWPWPNTLPRPNSGVWFGWEITGYFVPEETGTYEFKIASDDRSDFFIDTDNDDDLSDETELVYYYEGPADYEATISLTKDTPYKFRVRYENGNGGANLYLKWTKPSDTADNHTFNSDEIYSVKPQDVPFHYDVNYKFRNMDETGFSINTYYEVSSSEIAQNSNSSAITLDGNGEATITSQVDTDLVGQGKYDITATPGSVEWVVTYAPMLTNKYRYRIGLDVREFPNGVDLDDVNNIELLDLVDTDGTSTYLGTPGYPNSWATTTSDAYWNNFNYYTWSTIPFSSSNYSSSIRSLGGGGYALKVELNFTEVMAYKTQSVFFNPPTTTELETMVDEVFTVADVVMAFNELAGGGINGGFKGDFDYNVQYANADVSRDGVFDFKDTQIMLDFLNGGTMFDASYLGLVMMLTDLTSYESMTSTNWTGYGGTRVMYPLGLSTGTKQYDKNIAVHWKGDVNMSHSHLPSNTQVTSMARNNMTISNSSKSIQNSFEVDLDIEKIEDEIVVTIKVPENTKNITGSEFRVGYDNSRVTFDRIENGSELQSFSAKRSTYIKLGSISSDGSQNLNGGTEYKIYFKEENNLTSFLGLVSVLKVELVKKDGTQIGVIVK